MEATPDIYPFTERLHPDELLAVVIVGCGQTASGHRLTLGFKGARL